MTIHVFNPEHDIALASGSSRQTAPHTARELRQSLGFLPALWASNGDIVLVSDVDYACKALKKLGISIDKLFILDKEGLKLLLMSLNYDSYSIDVWGWDAAIRHELHGLGIDIRCLPSDKWIDDLRQLSHRKTAVSILKSVKEECSNLFAHLREFLVGESFLAESLSIVEQYSLQHDNFVVKSPWSSSGRGVKFVNNGLSISQRGWISNVLNQQGSVVIEPHYSKILDFGMEFSINNEGVVNYCGLSVFFTEKGAWTGNLIDEEDEKMRLVSSYVPQELLIAVREVLKKQLASVCHKKYKGVLGVDMMIVGQANANHYFLHPCVEINFRRTMGHVALAMCRRQSQPRRAMRIVHNVNYELKTTTIDNNFVVVL